MKTVSMRFSRLPCLRSKVTDVMLSKSGHVPGYEWTRRWSNGNSDPIQKWKTKETKTLSLSEGYSQQSLLVEVRQFVPQKGDKLQRSWCHNGRTVSVSIPPYALIDFDKSKIEYMKYIHESMGQTFESILGRSGGLLNSTYQQALQCCKDRSTSSESLALLRNTFRLWMAVRFATKSVFIVGEETLDIPVLDETSPDAGKIPIPPVLGAQLDVILIHQIQAELRRNVLQGLDKMLMKRETHTWMVRYLVIFMLLHNTALITAHDAGYARKHGIQVKYVTFAKSGLID